MRVIKNLILIILSITICISCKKSSSGGGGGGSTVKEENLIMGIDPDPGNGFAQSLGLNYQFTILVQSKMPALGVKVDIICKKESDNSVVFSQSLQSNVTSLSAAINNLPFNEMTIVTITVTSKSTLTNTASKTFRLIKK